MCCSPNWLALQRACGRICASCWPPATRNRRCLQSTGSALTGTFPFSASPIDAPNWPKSCARSRPTDRNGGVSPPSFAKIETVGWPVTTDLPCRRRREMRRQDQRAAIGVFLDEPGAADARALRVGACHRRPFRLQALQRVVQNVADEHAAIGARFGVDYDIARGMAGISLEPQPVVERIVVADKQSLPSLDHRQDAVAKGARMRRVDAALVDSLPMVVFALRHHVARLREGRHPLPVLEPRIPADMVPVQVRTHDKIDVFRLDADTSQIVDERGFDAVELRAGGTLLVIADAGIDQDRVPVGFDDETVKAENQLAGSRLD